jgi:crotonobetainyl-CoA:carnitine CoA-transferase CaiB-like acyl-CoA transferase
VKPLEDLRIVSLEQYGAGPFGSMHLADLGAEVIKIEDPSVGGDVGRYVPPYTEGEDSLFFESFNRNKRSISIDLNTEAGRSVFEEMVKTADVVYSNLRGDVPEKMRIRYDDLKHLNPKIVCVSLTGFGMTGPRRNEPGYDYVLQGLAGWMDLTGEPGGPPTKSGLSMVDYSGGFVAAISLLAGVHAARRDGVGMDCDVSLYDTAVTMLNYPATWMMNAGFQPVRTRHSAHPSLVPFQAFEASDGWMIVGCAKEKFWTRLSAVVGHPEWGEEDNPYGSFTKRRERKDELIAQLEEIFKTRTVEEWLPQFYTASIPCGPINDVEAALKEEHTVARNLIVETDHPRYGTIRQMSSPIRVGNVTPTYRRAPQRNEDFDHVTREILGLDDEAVGKLAAAGAFGAVVTTTKESAEAEAATR